MEAGTHVSKIGNIDAIASADSQFIESENEQQQIESMSTCAFSTTLSPSLMRTSQVPSAIVGTSYTRRTRADRQNAESGASPHRYVPFLEVYPSDRRGTIRTTMTVLDNSDDEDYMAEISTTGRKERSSRRHFTAGNPDVPGTPASWPVGQSALTQEDRNNLINIVDEVLQILATTN